MNWEWVVMRELKLVLSVGYFLGSHFAASDSVDKSKLFIGEDDVSHIELISDGSPPIFIFRFLNKLF